MTNLPPDPQGPPPAAGPVPPAAYQQQPYAQQPQPYTGAAAPAQPKVLSIISMITGILGVISFGWGFIFSIAAIVLGFMGKKREPAAKGFWMTGIITGFVGIAIALIGGIILAVAWFSLMAAGSYTTY